MVLKKYLALLTVLLGCLILTNPAQAGSSFNFYPLKVEVKKGQTFNVQVRINPNDVTNYTIKTNIDFPADLLTLQTWKYGGDWIPVRKDGYDFFDNKTGVLIRTAGYANGFNQTMTFGTATFVAKNTGTGVISFTGDNLALDQDGNNVYAGGNKVSIAVLEETTPTITTKPTTTKKPTTTITPTEVNPPVGEMVPVNPVDITLNLAQNSLNNASELNPIIKLSNTDNTTTTVALNFKIWNDNGVEMFNYNDTLTVNTSSIYDNKLTNLNLRPGAYVLSVTAAYSSTTQELRQPFIINDLTPVTTTHNQLPWWVLTIIVSFVLLLGYTIWALFIKKEKHRLLGRKGKK